MGTVYKRSMKYTIANNIDNAKSLIKKASVPPAEKKAYIVKPQKTDIMP